MVHLAEDLRDELPESPELVEGHDRDFRVKMGLPHLALGEIITAVRHVQVLVIVLQDVHQHFPSAVLELIPIGGDLLAKGLCTYGEQPAHHVPSGLLPVNDERPFAEPLHDMRCGGSFKPHGTPASAHTHAQVRSPLHLVVDTLKLGYGMLEITIHAHSVICIHGLETFQNGSSQSSLLRIPHAYVDHGVVHPAHGLYGAVRGVIIHEKDFELGVSLPKRLGHRHSITNLVINGNHNGHRALHALTCPSAQRYILVALSTPFKPEKRCDQSSF